MRSLRITIFSILFGIFSLNASGEDEKIGELTIKGSFDNRIMRLVNHDSTYVRTSCTSFISSLGKPKSLKIYNVLVKYPGFGKFSRFKEQPYLFTTPARLIRDNCTYDLERVDLWGVIRGENDPYSHPIATFVTQDSEEFQLLNVSNLSAINIVYNFEFFSNYYSTAEIVGDVSSSIKEAYTSGDQINSSYWSRWSHTLSRNAIGLPYKISLANTETDKTEVNVDFRSIINSNSKTNPLLRCGYGDGPGGGGNHSNMNIYNDNSGKTYIDVHFYSNDGYSDTEYTFEPLEPLPLLLPEIEYSFDARLVGVEGERKIGNKTIQVQLRRGYITVVPLFEYYATRNEGGMSIIFRQPIIFECQYASDYLEE